MRDDFAQSITRNYLHFGLTQSLPFTARVTSDAPVKIDTDATVNDYRCATLLGGEAPSRLTINDLLIAAPLLAGQHSALIAQSIVGRPFVANHQVELS